MRRILLFLMLFALAGCTAEDVEAALRFLHGTPRVYAMFEVDGVGGESNIPDALDRTAAVVQRRLDLAGIDATAEGFSGETAVIVVQGAVGDLDALIALVTRPGRLEFTDLRNAPVALVNPPTGDVFSTSAHPVQDGLSDPDTGEPYPTVLDAVQVIDAEATLNDISGTWDILLTFSPEHGAILSEYTAANIGTTMGILIDGRVLSAPIIQAQVGEQALITGNFSEAEARELAAVIGGGMLPFPLTLSEVG
jgi:preprotein translocase subunit SecD